MRKLLPGKTPFDGNGSSGRMTGHRDPTAWEIWELGARGRGKSCTDVRVGL